MNEGLMECLCIEDGLPALRKVFRVIEFVPYFSIRRRLLDTMYGSNYDLSRPLDRAIYDWLWQMDRHYIGTEMLKQETFFGIYRNG